MSEILSKNSDKKFFTKKNIGGKAFYLESMKSSGLQIPEFIIVSVKSVNEFIAPIRQDIENILMNTNYDNVIDASRKIAHLFDSVNFSDSFISILHTACHTAFGLHYKLAVRSSAPDEDGENTSFAGQHKSYLYVEKTKLPQKIKASIISAWSVNALTYRLSNHLSLKNIEYAVILQKMVDATKSGVGFSMNIQGNMAEMVLVAGYGLGEGIVSDLVETDSYFINRLDNRISQKIVTKQKKVVYSTQDGVHVADVEAYFKESAVLNKQEIIAVGNLLKKTAQILGKISDIEFSFDNKNELHLLQMRPVTGINTNDIQILDNTNIVESYPGISLPLTFDFVSHSYTKVFESARSHFWVPTKTKEELQVQFNNLLGYYSGRIYYRLDNWYQLMSQLFPSEKSLKSWEKAVGLKKDALANKQIRFGVKTRAYLSIFWLLVNYKRGNKRFFSSFDKQYQELKDFKTKKTAAELLNHLRQVSDKLYSNWYLTLINDLISFKSFSLLQRLIIKHNIGVETLANDLLSGQINSDSEKAITQLLFLKETIEKDELLLALFSQPNSQIIKELKKPQFEQISREINQYLDQYGDRTLAALKLETTSLRQDRSKFLNLLKSQLQSDANIKKHKKGQQWIYTQAIKLVHERLKWWHPSKFLFMLVLKLSQYGLKNRENMRFARTRVFSGAKDIYLEIGKIMSHDNYIATSKDIFFLHQAEIQNYVEGGDKKNSLYLVEKRQKQFANYAAVSVPDRIMYLKGNPILVNKKGHYIKNTEKVLNGISVAKGIVTAKAKVVLEPNYKINLKGHILVSKITDPGWVFLMSQSVGLISEKGSLLSHTAIVGRELGIPVIVGVEGASSIIKTGNLLKLNATEGCVEIQ